MDQDDEPAKVSGRVKFDDRGNAIWEWAMATGAFGRDVSPARLRSIEHPGLSIVDDDAPPPSERVRTNPLGIKKGYDPYDSGNLAKQGSARKKDLRKLGEWLKLKKQVETNKKKKQGDPE
jgi:hypothetical protein